MWVELQHGNFCASGRVAGLVVGYDRGARPAGYDLEMNMPDYDLAFLFWRKQSTNDEPAILRLIPAVE